VRLIRNVALWLVAVAITLVSAWWQRTSGPTYPVATGVTLGGARHELVLERSHGGADDQPIRLVVPDPEVTGEVAWRRFPTGEPWNVEPLRREGDTLVAALPHQPPAGKLEYQVRLRRGAESAVAPAQPAVTRFKGDVPVAVLLPHILFMFAAMLVSNRAGLEALVGGGGVARLAVVTFGLLLLGGFVLGPAVQKYAFGEWWAGVPFGWDLTDNKTLMAGIAWLVAVLRLRGGRSARVAVVVAALVTIAVFAIPHSAWGSQLRWDEVGGAR
jgi:hypothetical protein